MIQWLMALALRSRVVVISAAVLLLLAGLYSFTQLDIEAYPDPVQPMTEVLTLPTGLSAEEVERLVTVPTEYGMSGMLHLKSMESISLYSLSDIRLYFDWDSDYEFDRTQTINQLTFVTLPQGIQPGLSPDNPIGAIYRYTVQGPDHDLIKEKEVENWVCGKQLKTVPGVLDVSGFGGLTKEYHVDLDPAKLTHYAIPLSQVIAAIQNSNTLQRREGVAVLAHQDDAGDDLILVVHSDDPEPRRLRGREENAHDHRGVVRLLFGHSQTPRSRISAKYKAKLISCALHGTTRGACEFLAPEVSNLFRLTKQTTDAWPPENPLIRLAE